ncbi:hydroxylysine kinase-like [Pecten maximus]|uniref:hydroxylysine kinase-like n=1 Tax=Pecten maximus TaxID=6579 RepID=UPI0014587D27|nr:hydroxylysine kinase-like [Pecten maximus]
MSVRPNVAPDDVIRLVNEVYGLTVVELKEFPAFEDRNFLVTCEPSSTRSENGTVQDPRQKTSECYIIKISGSRDKNDDSEIENQRLIMDFLTSEDFWCPQFVKTISDQWFHWYDQHNDPLRMRMLTYVPGDPLMDHWTGLSARETLVSLGEFVSQLHLAFEKLTQSGTVQVNVDTQDPWKMDNFLGVTELLHEIHDVTKRRLISEIVLRFQEEVLGVVDSLSSGIIHGDIHDMNIIVNIRDGKLRPIYQPNQEPGDSDSVKKTFGLIDFGDVSFSRYVFEVSMVIRDTITDVKTIDPVEIAGHFLAGYLKHRPLNSVEVDVLFVCIQAALCQYIVLGEYEYKLQPDNAYTKLGAEDAWKQLQVLQKLDKSQVLQTWSTLLSSSYNLVI